MAIVSATDTRVVRRKDNEQLWIEQWGTDGLRIRVTRNAKMDESTDWALLPREEIRNKPDTKPVITLNGQSAIVRNGGIEARLNTEGWLSFYDRKGNLLLEEFWRNRDKLDRYASPLNISSRCLSPILGGEWRANFRFEAKQDEKIYGLGQYQDLELDKKGSVLELAHRNTQASVPFALSSRGYGFLWNNPGIGKVSFANNVTEWTLENTCQIDYWITAADSPAEIMERYCRVTGTVPMMPEFGLGFTQCKMRYKTQDELMTVAREHKRRGLPIDMIVADFFHWTMQGDWDFDPINWPDVDGMISELKSMNIELMVSIWPTIDVRSETYREMEERGLLVSVDRGMRLNMTWMGETTFFDATNPEAREYVWARAKKNYFDRGIRIFWLDEAEPEFGLYDFDIWRFHAGPALRVSNIYPLLYAKGFYDGMKKEGMEQVVNLVRTAWAGSQRYGAMVWSGDIHSSFHSMRIQLAAGLSMAIAGIPWWTTDIGGFIGGETKSPAFRELLVRWFQWGAFCPIFRLHGDRLPYEEPAEKLLNGIQQMGSGAPNEIWEFGDEAYPILEKYLHVRERLKPYIREMMKAAHETGAPLMRPLFYDFPGDTQAWKSEDAYMFGPDLLVAPIFEAGTTYRSVYLPANASWTDAETGR